MVSSVQLCDYIRCEIMLTVLTSIIHSPPGETCFRGVECTSENPRPPPTQKPSEPPTPEPTPFVGNGGRCAIDYGDLIENCWTAMECNNTHPCGQNLTCFEDIDCVMTNYSISESPTISPMPSSVVALVNGSLSLKQNYCASSEADLYANCTDAPTCNDGDSPCPSGTFCFGEHICIDAGHTMSPTPSSNESWAPISTNQPPSSRPSSDPLIPTPTEPDLFCASSMDDLHASCASAQSCNDGPCPAGLYCFPFTCASSVSVEEPVMSDGGTYYCAKNESELKDSCGMLTQCNNELPPCPEDTSCLRYNCQQNIDMCPLNYVGWQSSRDCLEYYYCTDGVAGPSTFCTDGLKFDKMRGECTNGLQLNEYCYGPPVPNPTPRPTGPPNDFCPNGVDGWHASSDCKEYYKCQDGEAGAIQVCPEGMKFDKVRNRCGAESVNNYCYGPALEEDTEPTDVLVETEGTSIETGTPTNESVIGNGSCLSGYSGWEGQSPHRIIAYVSSRHSQNSFLPCTDT